MALENYGEGASNRELGAKARIVGVLPLVHLKHPIFGNSLVSIPFFDMGGILANDEEAEISLLFRALVLAGKLKADRIELRQAQEGLENSLGSLGYRAQEPTNSSNPTNSITFTARSNKVRMVLNLPESSALLMDSFKAKLRSQIKSH